MAQAWLKKYLRIKPEVHQIFNDLGEYRLFCRDHGYPFNEADLYKERSPWGDMRRAKSSGRPARDNWYSRPFKSNPKYRTRSDG